MKQETLGSLRAVVEEEPPLKLEYFERALRGQPGGAALADAFAAHVEEVVTLVNRNRRVATVWQRYHGPRFIQEAAAHRTRDGAIPKVIDGVRLETLLLHMADTLQRHGSPELQQAIADCSLQVLRWARACWSVDDVLRELGAWKPNQERTDD